MNWSELDLSVGQRHALQCSDESQRDRWLDEICLHLQQHSVRYGLLHQHGALLGNITVQHNILLAATWRHEQTESALQQKMRDIFSQLGYRTDDELLWLSKRPNQLTNFQLRAAIIARSLLAEPAVLVCDEPWFVEQNRAELQLLQRADTLWPNCCWLVVYADALPPLPGANWQHHELPALSPESDVV